jgi:HSP20 family protein
MLTKYNPLRNLIALDQPLFYDWFWNADKTTSYSNDPREHELFDIKTKETDTEHLIHIVVAGFGKDDISVEVVDSTMSIRGKKETDNNGWDSFNTFSRTFTLPENILVDKIKAALKDGILLITIPKKKRVTKKIAIEVS